MTPPVYKLRVPAGVAGLIRGMHPGLKRKIKASLKTILNDPGRGKALKNELAGLKSFRASRFRIIYRVAGGNTIEVVAVGPRKSIYEETFRFLRGKDRKP